MLCISSLASIGDAVLFSEQRCDAFEVVTVGFTFLFFKALALDLLQIRDIDKMEKEAGARGIGFAAEVAMTVARFVIV